MAIAFDAASAGTEASGGISWSHTCTGENRLLVVICKNVSGAVSGVTYAGVSMTNGGQAASGSVTCYFFYLLNPASGTNTISVSANNTNNGCAMSYTGVEAVDGSAGTANAGSGTSLGASATTSKTGSWLMSGIVAGDSIVAGANTTKRAGSDGGGGVDVGGGDSNAAQTPGSNSQNYSWTGSTGNMMVVLGFSPTTAINVSDDITITESAIATYLWLVNVSDDVAISESITSAATIGDISVSDTVTLLEFIFLRDPVNKTGVMNMKSKQNTYPLGMDDKTIL